MQKLALEARAEGKKYKPPKKRAATDAAKAKAAKPEAKPKAKAGKPDAKAGKKEETGTRPEGDVDVSPAFSAAVTLTLLGYSFAQAAQQQSRQ